MQSKLIKYTTPLLLAFLGFLIYSNVLHGTFILDDEMYITDNYQIRYISNLLNDFSGTRYIGFLSFAVNYYFGGLNTFGYHLVNIIIHIINAILVYFFVSLTLRQLRLVGQELRVKDPQLITHESQSLTHDSLIAFSVSLIFLVHPIQTQAVSYISQRFTSLAALFYLLALVLYIKTRLKDAEAKRLRGRFNLLPFSPLYLLSLLSAILAMKTKEISFTLPFIIILYEFTFFRDNGHSLRTRFLYLIPFFLTLLIIPLSLFWPREIDELAARTDVAERIRQLQIRDIKTVPVYDYFITQFSVIVTYIRLMFLPINQTFEYDYPLSQSMFEPATFISFIFLLSFFVFAVYLYIHSRITHTAF